MIEIPVSGKIPIAAWPRHGVSDYLFTVRSAGGLSLGNGIREFDWTLQVDARRGLLSLEYFRSDANIAGEPIGLFRHPLDDSQLKEFHQLVIASRLRDLQPAMKGHPGYTERHYSMSQPGTPGLRLVVNNDDRESNAAIAPVRYKINALLAGAFAHPERAIRAELSYAHASIGEVFTVTVKNIGIEKVCFTDPRWITPAGVLQNAVIRMTEFPEQAPGAPPQPLLWKESSLAPLPGRSPSEPLITMAPGAIWKVGAPVVGRAAGKRYLAYFSWANYAGQPMVDGGYRIRGLVESTRLVLEGAAG